MQCHIVKRIVILGGGTAGWMTAASLAKHFSKTDIKISVIDSSAIGTVGVGEATIPTLRRFYAELGMSDQQVLKATGGTIKLGIQFRGWQTKGSQFIHPFGGFGQQANGIAFHHYWLKAKTLGSTCELADYNFGLQLAQHQKFLAPSASPQSELSVFDWALHFDAAKFAALMRSYAIENKVEHIDKNVVEVCRKDNGNISALTLQSGHTVEGDLFIDCSGFSALLIDKSLATPYLNWSEWLVCDSALAVQTEINEEPAPYTISQAHAGGWQWRIPLQHRQGNGLVYSSRYISDKDAQETLFANLTGATLNSPKKFSFTPGRRLQAWNKNCIAVGLSSGFLEPLESTSIALIETAIEKIKRAFRHPFYTEESVKTFNELTAAEYERVRDFIILHYKANQRIGEPLWDHCRAMTVPETLQRKIDAFKRSGELIRYPVDIFGPPSWLAVYNGLKITPDTYNSGVNKLDDQYLLSSLAGMRQSIARAVQQAPRHHEYLQENIYA